MTVLSRATSLGAKTGKAMLPGRGLFVTCQLALRDLMHEPLITMCLVFSVVAVLAPILLLTSVKVGFIDSLRQQFIEDPSFREIRPGSADLRPQELFDRITGWDGIEYVVPTVMMNPREVAMRASGRSGIYRDSPRLLPSTAGDPFLKRITGKPPAGDGVVLTKALLDKAGLEIGDPLTLGVTRIVNDERSSVRFDVKVSGWVPTDAADVPTILAAPIVEQQVEAYRAGIAVPERGWAGVNAEPRPSFQRMLVIAPNQLGATLETELRVRVGAVRSETVKPVQVAALIGAGSLTIPDAKTLLLLDPGSSYYTDRDVDEANLVLSNSAAHAVGLSLPREAQLLDHTLSLSTIPEGATSGDSSTMLPDFVSHGNGYVLNDRIILPEGVRSAWEAAGEPVRIEVRVTYPEGASTKLIDFPLRHVGFHDGKTAIVLGPLMGLLNRGNQILLDFDPRNRQFIERNAGFRGFRIVAENIDVIPSLEERFVAEGISVKAKSSQILKLQRLEESLNLLVVVVATVALAGGLSILTASFFANVQRKRVAYATLRLIGMPKRRIAAIPVVQAVFVASAGFLLSVMTYFLIAALLNGAVSEELDFDGQLSRLYVTHFCLATVIVLGGSCLASLAASHASTRIDPATALRNG